MTDEYIAPWRVAERRDWHKRYMASLDDAGIGSKTGRKPWQAEQGFPASTKDWDIETYRRAVSILLHPYGVQVIDLCKQHDIDPDALLSVIWSDPSWLRVRDYIALINFLETLPDTVDRVVMAANREGLGA